MGTILCYGDSNTWGFDSREVFGGRYPETVRWAEVLAQKSGWEVLNCGMNGREIPHTPYRVGEVQRLAEQNAAAKPPVRLWVMLGTNDLLRQANVRAEDVCARMERFLQELMHTPSVASGAVRLRLIAPPPMQAGSWTDERIIAESLRLPALYAALAKQLGIAFAQAGELPLLYDGVHFAEQGHLLFAQRMLEILKSEEMTL